MVTGVLRKIRDGLLGLTYPASCRVCGDAVESWSDGVACARCWDDPIITTYFDASLCRKCGLPSDGRTGETQADDCPRCAASSFYSARACGAYDGALEASVLFLKTHPFLCQRLKRLLFETYSRAEQSLAGDVTIPVPLHPARQRERGFNQAEVIASQLAAEFGLRLEPRLLKRTKYTERHRAGLDLADRLKSVENAFEAESEGLRGRSVLLLDDVLTTGSTLASATSALLAAGSSRVSILTVARVYDVARGKVRVA
jgi:ComF family protein